MRETSMVSSSSQSGERCLAIILLLILTTTPCPPVTGSESAEIWPPEETLKTIVINNSEIMAASNELSSQDSSGSHSRKEDTADEINFTIEKNEEERNLEMPREDPAEGIPPTTIATNGSGVGTENFAGTSPPHPKTQEVHHSEVQVLSDQDGISERGPKTPETEPLSREHEESESPKVESSGKTKEEDDPGIDSPHYEREELGEGTKHEKAEEDIQGEQEQDYPEDDALERDEEKGEARDSVPPDTLIEGNQTAPPIDAEDLSEGATEGSGGGADERTGMRAVHAHSAHAGDADAHNNSDGKEDEIGEHQLIPGVSPGESNNHPLGGIPEVRTTLDTNEAMENSEEERKHRSETHAHEGNVEDKEDLEVELKDAQASQPMKENDTSEEKDIISMTKIKDPENGQVQEVHEESLRGESTEDENDGEADGLMRAESYHTMSESFSEVNDGHQYGNYNGFHRNHEFSSDLVVKNDPVHGDQIEKEDDDAFMGEKTVDDDQDVEVKNSGVSGDAAKEETVSLDERDEEDVVRDVGDMDRYADATKKEVPQRVEVKSPSKVNVSEISDGKKWVSSCAGGDSGDSECGPERDGFSKTLHHGSVDASPTSSSTFSNERAKYNDEQFVNDNAAEMDSTGSNSETESKFVMPPSFMHKKKETASLAFVFDTTGSMHDDLMQAREGVKAILKAFLEYDTLPVSNYILVPFNDPLIEPITVTEDPEEFVKVLDELEIHGGGDCPEMSSTGILEALKKSHPNSFLYVFSDAPSKDYNIYSDVLEVVQRKHSQVNFFLSGLCLGKDIMAEAYKVYDKMAIASGGQVFLMTKDDIKDAMNYLQTTLHARRATVYSVNRPEPLTEKPHSEDFNITVEKDLEKLTVILTGNQPTIEVKNPSGESAKALKTVLDLPNAVVVDVDDPKPAGTWNVNITIQPKEPGSRSKTIPDGFTLVAKGTGSVYHIQHGFSVQPAANLKETAKRPLEGMENYLTIEIHPFDGNSESLKWLKNYNWTSVDFTKIDGGMYWSLPLKLMNSEDDEDPEVIKLTAGPFSPPNDLFILSFHGIDGDGNPVTRVAPNAISPQHAEPPLVTMISQLSGFSGKNLTIRCQVESLLPFTLEWYKDFSLYKGNLSFNQSYDAHLVIDNLIKRDEGDYRCKATNIRGSTLSSPGTAVSVIEPPKIVENIMPKAIITENSNVVLDCEVKSDLNHSVKWTHEHRGKIVELTNSQENHKYQQLKNNSLLISSVKNSDSGVFICSATNLAGTTTKEIELQIVSQPELVTSPEGEIYFTEGEDIMIECKNLGNTLANISWEFDGVTMDQFSKSTSNFVNVITIPEVDKQWSGRYVCVAVNEAGKAHKEVKGIYFDPPVVKPVTSPYMALKEGDDAVMSCSVIGKSNVTIVWFYDGNPLENSEKHQISSIGLSLKVQRLRKEDEGIYVCEAIGIRGTKDSTQFEVRLGTPPKPRLIPYDTSLNLGEDGWFNCSAENETDIGHFPEMAVRTSWKRENGVPLDLVRHEVLDSGTLHIIDAGISDEGIYICSQENAFGKVDHEMELQLTGFTPPLITGMHHPKLEIPERKSVLLNCTVISDTDYEVKWYHHHDGIREEILSWQNERIQKLENKSLLISTVNKNDSGLYECHAANRAGETSKEVELFVILPPKISTIPENKFEFYKGESIDLHCSVGSDTVANISWEFNGLRLSKLSKSTNSSSKSVTIPYADEEWEGIYICTAVNEAGKVQKEILGVYAQPPEVIPENTHVAVKMGGTAEMRCIVNGQSNTNVTWFYNGHTLSSGPKYEISSDGESLRIFDSNMKDEGMYNCVAEGAKNLKSSSSIHMIIGRLPKPKQPYPSASLKLGEEGLFPCIVEAESEISLYPGMESKSTWKRKNKALDPERHSILASGGLLITNATTSDDGVYVCTLENDFGKIDLEMDLEIIGLVPPVLASSDDEEINYLDGDNVVLWCNASGLPNPTISWFYKGEGKSKWERLGESYYDVKGMSIEGRKLTIENAGFGNHGLYSCSAENDAGFAEKIYYLQMKAPPVLMDNEGPVDISLVEGESFSLQCSAKGVPDPIIKWIKDGMELPEESFDGGYHIVDGGAILEILMAKTGTSDGYYACSAENSVGKVQKSFKVKVLVPPAHGSSYFGRNVAVLKVKLGDPLTITCPIATGLAVPAPTYGWSKDGNMLHAEQVITSENGRTLGHLQINDNGKTLHIDGVTLDDAGNYSCVGFNKAGRVVSPAAEVVVSIAPVHSPNMKNISVYEVMKGENVTFNCSVMGIPKPKVVWSKDGNYLSENHPDMKYDYVTKEKNLILSQLTIINVQGYHAGSYKCLSNNHIGKSSLLYDLSVLIPPYVLGLENNILEVGEGESVVLSCTITGNPKPNITWHKLTDGHYEKLRKSRIANPSAIEISNLREEENGIYICTGTNSIGSAEMTFNVSVLVAPSLEGSSPVIKVVAIGENITLKCSPTGSPSPSLRWFKNGYLIGNTFDGEIKNPNVNAIVISKDGRDMVINNASKDDDGNYTCISYNKAGRIERTFHVETVAPPLFLDWNVPDVVKVLNGSKVSFDCSAIGKPAPKVTWTRTAPNDLITVHKSQNQPLVDSKGLISSTLQLAFESIQPQDLAVYKCEAENKAGTSTRRFYLDVHVPPFVEGYAGDEHGEPNRIGVIRKQPGSLTVQVVIGQTFTLSCRVLFGRPSPHLLWLRNGKKILKNIHQSKNPYRYTVDDSNSITAHGVYVIDSDETLVISNITEEESGPYKCAASNEAGASEVNFNVEVFVPPSLEEGSNVETVFSVKVYSFIALICPVTGIPMPHIKWFKDSEEIDEEYANVFQMSQDKRRLVIMQAKVENTGEYTCVATNEAGTKKINYKVTVFDEQSEWSPWSSWSVCSSSCGSGNRKRYRECSVIQANLKQLVPSYYRTSDNQIDLPSQASCPGENVQVQKCFHEACPKPSPEEYRVRSKKKKVKRVPKRASLSLQGKLNGRPLSPSHASASFNPWNNGPTLEAEVEVDPYQQGNLYPYLPFILSPLTWSAAGEIDDASNGYSLTDGVFEQRSQLEFMSGETMFLSHKGQGVDSNTGELKVEIEVEGEVPQYQSDSSVYLTPFSESYVQTSPSSLYSWSENDLNVDGKKIPYKWNSSLHYDSTLGTMSYLAEQLSLEDLNTYNDYENHKIVYSTSPKISKKYPTNRCPDGYNSDEENLHCVDIDECSDDLSECHETQRCKNEMGSYQCLCPEGFTSKAVGHPCIDVNECIGGENPCSHDCHNTQGSYYCSCPKGLEIMADKHTCERKGTLPSGSEKTKLPMLDLLPDYHIVPLVTPRPPAQFWSSYLQKQRGSVDHPKDFTQEPKWPDDEINKKCSSGYEFIGGKCQDIDECTQVHRTHKVRHQSHRSSPCPLPGQQCVNTNGSYHCIEMSCSLGYSEVEVDISGSKESIMYCLQLCDTSGPSCQEKAEIAQIVINSIITIGSLKPRRAIAQFSVPITARNSLNETKTLASTTRTTFHKLEEETGSSKRQLLQLFRVRSEGTDGILYAMKEFNVPGIYRVAVMALTYNGYSHHVLYANKFVLNIYVTGN